MNFKSNLQVCLFFLADLIAKIHRENEWKIKKKKNPQKTQLIIINL